MYFEWPSSENNAGANCYYCIHSCFEEEALYFFLRPVIDYLKSVIMNRLIPEVICTKV